MEHLISKSGKNRQGHSYTKEGHGQPKVTLDHIAGPWKQIVVLTDSGRKRVNGKTAYVSKTKHVRA